MDEKAIGEGGSAAVLVPPKYANEGTGPKVCPVCGSEMNGNTCPACGYHTDDSVAQGEAAKYWRVDFSIKSVTEDEKGTLVIAGYGNTWEEDRDGETVAPDAFNESLKMFMTNPVLLLNHKKEQVIGTVTGATPDHKGLAIVAEVPKPDDKSEPWHIKAYHDIKRGILKAFSMGGIFHRSKAVAGLIRYVDLYEISVVTIPANPTSLFAVAAVKGWDGFEEKTPATGVGRGHGAHHRGPLTRGARARHRHPNGRAHRHRGGARAHTHGTATTPMYRPRKDAMGEEDFEEGFVLEDSEDGDDLYEPEADIDEERDAAGITEMDSKAAWTTAYINDLPDSSFAYIEPGGEKDGDGKTTPRSLRHFPYKDSGGKVDLPHLRNALARAPQSPFGDKAMPKLRAAARTAGVGDQTGSEILNEKEATVGEPGTKEGGGEGDKSGTVTIDKKEWDATQATLRKLAEQSEKAEKEAEADRLAKERIEAEQKSAKDEAAQKEARQKEIDAMVETKLAALRAGMSTGTKFNYGGAPGAGAPGGAKAGNLAEFCIKLVRSKKGDAKAFEWLVAEDAKAAEAYGMKAYGEGTSAGGGFLVPPAYLQTGLAEFRLAQAKIRQLVTVIRGINTNSVLIPRETGISTVGWTAESASKPSTDATFGQISVGIYTLAGIAKVSNQLLEDSTPAVDQIVRRALGKSIGQQEDIAFINGTGVGQPTGILNTAGVLTGAVGAKLWSSIAGAITTIQSNYFGNPTAILAHPRDVNTLRTTTDTAGRPIFLPNYWMGANPAQGGGQAFMGAGAANPLEATYNASPPDGYVFGLPVYSDANIPTNLGGGTNETRMIIAAWEEAWILERDAIGLDVSNEAGTSFEQNQTWFRAETRLGFTAARQPSAFYVMTGLTAGAGL